MVCGMFCAQVISQSHRGLWIRSPARGRRQLTEMAEYRLPQASY